jgi:hypothetical protein
MCQHFRIKSHFWDQVTFLGGNEILRDQVTFLGGNEILRDQVTFLGGNEILSGFLHSKIYARILEHHPRPGFTSGNY